MEIKQRKTIFDDLKKYCILADKNDYIEITEWTNGEGHDVTISSKSGTRNFSLTYGELEAINYLIKTMDFKDES